MNSASRLLGFDVGGTHVRLATGTRGGEPTAGPWAALPSSYDGLLKAMAAMAHEACPSAKVAGVGVGLPGVVDEHVARWVPNVPFVVDRSLVSDLTDVLDAPVFLGNDAQVALLGEARFGAARELRNAALFTIGTGVGGAILVGNRVLRGSNGAAGSFGWVNVDADGLHDPDHGQLELLTSGRAIDAMARLDERFADGPALVEAARRGDASAASQLTACGRLLGVAMATVASTLDPEAILVTGGVSEAFDLLQAGVRESIYRFASPTGRAVPVRVGALGSRAGAWGAVALAGEGRGAFIR